MNPQSLGSPLRIALLGAVALCWIASTADATTCSAHAHSLLASPVNPYAAFVIESSNKGLQAGLRSTVEWRGGARESWGGDMVTFDRSLEEGELDTTGLYCRLLTLEPAEGCLPTQLSICTSLWCTSTQWDVCTKSTYCTVASICTNVSGCTDAGECTQRNGCTGGATCTEGAGCTQHASCTNGEYCTNDAGLCTGGEQCTAGTGCTNGDNCTAGSGCTVDSQCTLGPNCTTGTTCTDGPKCPDLPADSIAMTSVSGGHMKELLARPGAPNPNSEPHFAPAKSLASLGWLVLLVLPGLMPRSRLRAV